MGGETGASGGNFGIRKSLWCNEQMRRNPLLNHVLFLQTKYIEAHRRFWTDWTERFGRSESASYSLRQWPGWQQGLLHVKIIGVKDQRYQQNAKEGAHFLSIVLEQLTRLESWFSHVHPELLLSLQQLIHFVLPAIESFQKRSHPGNAYAMTHDLWEDHCGGYSILAKNLGWRGWMFLLPLQTWLHKTNIPRHVLGCLKKLVYDWLLQRVPASRL